MIDVTNKTNRYFILALLTITVVTLVPFIYTGYATFDDLEYYITCQNNGIWNDSVYYAKKSGRFYLLLTMPIHYSFHIFDNIIISKSLHIFFIFLNYATFAFIIKEIFNNKWIGYLTFLISILFISIKGENNAIISYPLYFSVSFLAIELAILFSIKFYQTQKKQNIYYCAFSYLFGLLFYEDYLIYFPLCIGFLCCNNLYQKESPLKNSILIAFKNCAPIIFVVSAYLTSYVVFRFMYNNNLYQGSNVSSSLNLSNFLKVVTNISKGAYPLFNYFSGRSMFYSESYILTNHEQNLGSVLHHAKTEWYLKSVIISMMFYYIIQHVTNVSKKKIVWVMAVSVPYIYLPQFLLGVTEKYIFAVNEWGIVNYVTTYFSLFPVAILFTLILIQIKNWIPENYWNKAFVFVLTLFIGFCSIINDYINYHALGDYEDSRHMTIAINNLVETKEFKGLPNKSFIYAPELYITNSQSNVIHTNMDWSEYFNMRNKTNLIVSNSNKMLNTMTLNHQHPVYYLSYELNKKYTNQSFTLSKINPNSSLDSLRESLIADSTVIFNYSAFKNFTITLYRIGKLADSIIEINGLKYVTQSPFIDLNISYANKNDFFKPIRIKATNIDLKSIHVIPEITHSGIPVVIE